MEPMTAQTVQPLEVEIVTQSVTAVEAEEPFEMTPNEVEQVPIIEPVSEI